MPRQKILVVDDDLPLHRLMELILQRAGYQVIMALSGEEAVEKVRTEKPDLVLMDVMMPGLDGFEATERIRRLPESRYLPIIFLSARSDVSAKVTGLRGGGDDYITKPVQAGEVLARIEAHLRTVAPAPGRLITVFGSEAGVGATTLAVNLTLALRQVSQKDVLLLDWQRPLGNVALFLGLSGGRTVEFLLARLDDLDAQLFAGAMTEYSPGVWVVPGATDPTCAGQMGRQALDQILKIALSRADYILVDAGHFFSWPDPPLIGRGMGINLCVLTPEPTPIKRAGRVVEAVNVTEHDLWLVLNRYSARDVPPEQVEAYLGTVLKGCVPDESEQAARALDEGRPLYVADPEAGFSRAVRDIAARVHETLTL